jgi:hypothetical protein
LVDELPTGGTTIMALNAPDFVIPGQWQNLTGFTNTIRAVTAKDEAMIQAIGERAVYLYVNDAKAKAQRAMCHQTVDNAAAHWAYMAANKIGQDVSLSGNLTPKPEKV